MTLSRNVEEDKYDDDSDNDNNFFASPLHRSLHIRLERTEKNPGAHDNNGVTIKSEEWQSPPAIIRRWENGGLPLLRITTRRSTSFLSDEQQAASFQVYYQSNRMALMLSNEGKTRNPKQPFELCRCTVLLVERSTSAARQTALASCPVLRKWPVPVATSTSSEMSLQLQTMQQQHQQQQLRSDSPKSIYTQHGRSPNKHMTPKPSHVLLLAEPGAVPNQNDNGDHPYSEWAQQWAREVMGQDFSAIYTLEQLPNDLVKPANNTTSNNHEANTNEQQYYKRWRKQVQSTLEQPMIVQQVNDDDLAGEEYTTAESKNLMILSRPSEVHGYCYEGDDDDYEADDNDDSAEYSPQGESSNFMTMLTKEGVLSSMACASIILQLCCSDHVDVNDSVRWDTLNRLYRQLVQHALLLCETKREERSEREEDELESCMDCLGRFALVLLQTGQKVVVAEERQKRHDEISKGASLLIKAFQDTGEHQPAELSLQEYFAAKFLVLNIQSDDKQGLDFVFNQDMAARHDRMLAHVAAEVSRRQGLDGMRSLFDLCRRDARDVVGVCQLFLELRLLNEWMDTIADHNSVKDGLTKLEAEFHILESFQAWFNAGVAHLRRGQGQESSRCLLSFLIAGLKGSSAILRHIPGYVDALLKACEDENESVRQTAADTISEVAKLDPTFDSGHSSVAKVSGLCEKENLRNSTSKAPAEGLRVASNLNTGCLSAILDTCKDESKLVRLAASKTLSQIAVANPLNCLPNILSACKSDKNSYVRAAAARAIGKVVEATPKVAERCMPTLIEACKGDRHENVREASTCALAEVAQANTRLAAKCLRVISELCKKDGSEHVRQAAALALARLALATPRLAVSCLTCLSDAYKDEFKSVRKAAVCALGDVVKSTPDFAAKYHGFLSDACKEDGQEVVRRVAVLALGEVATANPIIASKCQQTLIDVAKNDTAEVVREAAVHALGKVAKSNSDIAPKCLKMLVDSCLQDKDSTVRKVAADAIGMHSELSEHFVPVLCWTSLRDDCKFRRGAAAFAIREIAKVNPSMVDCISFHLDANQDDDDDEADADRNGVAHAAMKRLCPRPECVAECMTTLADAHQEAEDSEARKAASFFMGELVKMDHAQECLPLLLQLAERSYDDHSAPSSTFAEPITFSLGEYSIEQLISGYWSTHNDALIPYIAEQYFHTPFFSFTNTRDQQCLVLYTNMGRRIEWEESPNQNVKEFVSKMAAYFQHEA